MSKPTKPNLTIAGGTQAVPLPKCIPRSLRLDEILALPAPKYLIRNRLPKAGLVFVYGPPKTGKTFFTLDICMSLASDEAWHGAATLHTGVLYVAGEGVQGLGIRMRAYIRRHGIKPRTRMRVIPSAITFHEVIAEIEAEMAAIEAEEGWRPGVLTLDSLARTKGNLDENSGEMAVYVAAADHFIKLGILVIVIHHPGKNGEKGLRGWSGLLGALDVEIYVSRTDNVCVARWTYIKDGQTPPPFTFELETVETGETSNFGDPITSCVVKPCDSMPYEQKLRRPTGNKGLIYELAGNLARAGKRTRSGRPVLSVVELEAAWSEARRVSKQRGAPSYFRRDLAGLINDGWLVVDDDDAWFA